MNSFLRRSVNACSCLIRTDASAQYRREPPKDFAPGKCSRISSTTRGRSARLGRSEVAYRSGASERPELLRFLPKPGAWMETFKQISGFVLLATVVFIL